VQVEPALERTVGDPAFALQQLQHLSEHFVERHGLTSGPLYLVSLARCSVRCAHGRPPLLFVRMAHATASSGHCVTKRQK
jgi:hypothetical protein